MIDKIFNLFSKKEKPKNLAQDYWQDLGYSMGYGFNYDNICLGWIYEGIFNQDRTAKTSNRFHGFPESWGEIPIRQTLGCGWYRYNLAII